MCNFAHKAVDWCLNEWFIYMTPFRNGYDNYSGVQCKTMVIHDEADQTLDLKGNRIDPDTEPCDLSQSNLIL